jgi:hypothetical protein
MDPLMLDKRYGEGTVHRVELLLGRRPTVEDDNRITAKVAIRIAMATYAKNYTRCNSHHSRTRNTLVMD